MAAPAGVQNSKSALVELREALNKIVADGVVASASATITQTLAAIELELAAR